LAEFIEFPVQSMAMKQNAEFTEGKYELRPYFWRLWTKVNEILACSRDPS